MTHLLRTTMKIALGRVGTKAFRPVSANLQHARLEIVGVVSRPAPRGVRARLQLLQERGIRWCYVGGYRCATLARKGSGRISLEDCSRTRRTHRYYALP